MSEVHATATTPARSAPQQGAALTELVNRLAQELAEARRALATAKHKLGTTSRTLEGRTQELTEARATLALLISTLGSPTEGALEGHAIPQRARGKHVGAVTPGLRA